MGFVMTSEAASLARASYLRAQGAEDFFPAFYQDFFERCPSARPMFTNTDFTRQHKLLQHAIGLLLSFHGHSSHEPNLLTRVADRHGKSDLQIDPDQYDPFVEALIATVRRFDPEFSPEAETAWRAATADGIAYMKSKS